jgi:hypothetical protein
VGEEGSDHGNRGGDDDEGVFDAAGVLVRYRRDLRSRKGDVLNPGEEGNSIDCKC